MSGLLVITEGVWKRRLGQYDPSAAPRLKDTSPGLGTAGLPRVRAPGEYITLCVLLLVDPPCLW